MICGGSLLGIVVGSTFISRSPRSGLHGTARSAGPVGEAGSGGGVPQTSQVYFAADFSSGIARRNDLSSLRSSAVAVEERGAFPWEQLQTAMAICADTCESANNGVCDEGRRTDWAGVPRDGVQVLCDLGTDCADCGPYKFNVSGNGSSFKADMPIKRLRTQNIEVRVLPTSTKPSFLMAFTNPAFDVDVSSSMVNGGAVEMGLTQVWYHRLKGQCLRGDGSRGLVVDVGGNFGWYSLFAASMGCRVVAWEPVPHFRDFFLYGVALNNFQHLVQVRDKVVSDQEGEHDLVVPQRGIWGTAGVRGMNIDQAIDNEGAYEHVMVPGERVDLVVREPVTLLKMDVEGFEPHALKSAQGLFEHYTVDNVVMEYSPGPVENSNRWEDVPDVPGMLTFLVRKGFTLLHVWDNSTRGHVLPSYWEAAPPPFSHITAGNLAFDVQDASQMQARTMGCNKPPELVERFNAWSGCNFIPEDLHPQSFRGGIGHNTNVFAVREVRDTPVGPPAGIFSLEQDLHDWFAKGEYGIGGRPCKKLLPTVQVRHRCPCTDEAVCGAEAALVSALAREGRMPPLGSVTR